MIQYIDWTTVIVTIIGLVGTVFAGIITYALKKYVFPWLESNNLMIMAQIAVNAVQSIWGSGYGQQKFNDAMKFLTSKGFDIKSEQVINAVQAAWQKMNIKQIAAGMKKDEETIETEQTEG